MATTPAELADLVRRHGPGLALYACCFCRSPDDAAQAALVKLALLETTPADPAAWLYCACRREALQQARSERRRELRERKAAGWFAPQEAPQIDAEAVRLALEKLPLALSEAVTLHLWGNLSFAQIGEVTSTSAATALRRYREALDVLRPLLEDCR